MPKISANSKGKRRRPATKSLTATLGTNDASFLDFIRKCLHWDPLQRLTADEGLRHPWMSGASHRYQTPDIYSARGMVGTANHSTSNGYGSRHVSTSYTKPTTFGSLPQVTGQPPFSSQRRDVLPKPTVYRTADKAHTSSGLKPHTSQAASLRIKPPIMDRLRGVDVGQQTFHKKSFQNTGLPPISNSHPVLSKTKFGSSDKSLYFKGKGTSLESLSRDVPVCCLLNSSIVALEDLKLFSVYMMMRV